MANYLRIKKEEESQYYFETGSNLFTESSNMDNLLQSQVQIKNETDVASSENQDQQKVSDNSLRRGYTWPQALKIGILKSEGLKLTSTQIYEHIKAEFPHYRTTDPEETRKWKLVVRQNLSKLKKVFKRDGPEGGVGQWFVCDKDGMKCILKKAILTSKDLKLSSTQIYEFVKKDFLYYADQEEKEEWKNYVVENLWEMDKVFKHEGNEHGRGYWMVIDEDGIKAQKTLPSSLPPSPNMSSSKCSVRTTLPSLIPTNDTYPKQVRDLQEKVKTTRELRKAFADSYEQFRKYNQTNIDEAIRSFNFENVEQLRRKQDEFYRQSKICMDQYYQLEINDLLQLQKLGALTTEDSHALQTLSKVVPNMYNVLYHSVFNAHDVPNSDYLMPQFNWPIQHVKLSKLNHQECLVRNRFNNMPNLLIPCYPMLKFFHPTNKISLSNLNKENSQVSDSNNMPARPFSCYPMPQPDYLIHHMTHNILNQQEPQPEDGEPPKKRFKSEKRDAQKNSKESTSKIL